jgi:dimeric dUTPase (all-alpha-NTP-PPase superfamily)
MKRAQLLTMLALQGALNSAVNPEWVTAGYPFLRAAYVESGEAMDHYGWKWWKKQTPDTEQFGVELIDILHFYLSHMLIINDGDLDDAATRIEQSTVSESRGHVRGVTFDNQWYSFGEMDVQSRVELLGAMAAVRRASWPLLYSLFNTAGMTDEYVFDTYVGKNVLNMFRQANGYKEGTYIKDWFGKEDNQVMSGLLVELAGVDPDDLPMCLEAALSEEYAKVTNAASYV